MILFLGGLCYTKRKGFYESLAFFYEEILVLQVDYWMRGMCMKKLLIVDDIKQITSVLEAYARKEGFCILSSVE